MTSQVSCQTGSKICSRVPTRGPRTVLIQKEGGGFGFTLRHFIVYPPDSVTKQPSEGPSSPSYSSEPPWRGMSAQLESMDTIFVREVKEGSCAHLAGLVTGDRIITINKQPLTGKTYSQVIDLIQNSGNTLHLLVVPKEDDILQRYFSGSAYQPVDRPSSHLDGPSVIGGRERTSIASTSATEPIYSRVQSRNPTHQQTPLDRSWPLRQPSSLQQCTSISYPSNCRSLDCLSNEVPIHPSNSIRPPSLASCNTRSLSESEKSCYHSPRHSVAEDSSRSRPFYASHSQDGDCKEALYGTTSGRPYRFQDTFSKLLIDMWYPQSKGLSHPVHHSKPENIYRMRDQGKPGLAGLFSKTMKAFLPPHESRHHEPWPESNNGYYGKPPKGGEYFDPCRETDILDSDSATDTEMPGSLNLVAHRLQQFESGSVQHTAQERTNMYRHEFSRVSSPNPCPIVQIRAAQFETLASPTPNETKSHSQKIKELSDRVADNGFHPVTVGSSVSNETSCLSSSAYHFKPVHPPEGGNSGLPHYAGVTYRRKHFSDQDKHVARRISYLKATAGERMLVESDLSEEDEKRAMTNLVKRPSTECEGSEHKIDKLKAFFGERTPKIREAIDPSQHHHLHAGDASEEDEYNDVLVLEPVLTSAGEPMSRSVEPVRAPPPMMESWLSCKLVFVQGKRSTDRSWRTVWALFRGSTLHLLRDKKEPSSSSHEVSQSTHPLHNGSEIYDTSINLKTTFTSIAHDYTKRKHVLRLRLANGTEYLFQAESQVSMLEWLCTLKAAGLETEKEYLWHHASVLEKAAAYEQQIGLHSHIQSNGSNATSSTSSRGAPAVPPTGQGVKGGSGVKLPFRHRSPTGHSPAVKTRRASHGDELYQGPRLGSVLRGRVSGGWRKTHSLQSEALPKGASVGVRLEECPLSLRNRYVPLLVDLCVQVVESQGLEMVGIFRVPGNNAAVSLLIEAVNQGALLPALSCSPSVSGISCLQDPRWKDVNVVSSLLKAFFRKLPEPLLTSGLYPKFIQASKMEEVDKRLVLLRALLHQLPRHHYETLKFLIQHLKRIVDHSHINKMEARNLAIVFGPTLVRPSDSSMVALVTDMSHQCYIIETLINYVDWLFSEHFLEELPCELSAANRRMSHPLPVSHSNMLLRNLQKMDQGEFPSSPNSPSITALAASTKPPQEMFSRELLSSLMFASHRKHSNRRKEQPLTTASSVLPSSNISSSPVSPLCSSDPCSPYNRNSSSSHSNRPSIASPLICTANNDRGPTKPLDSHETGPLGDEVVHHTYDEINCLTQERIRRFERETRALLRREQPLKSSSAIYSSKGSSEPNSLPSSGAVKPGESDRKVEWQQIELEWAKAKRELEQDDLLDVVADDPSFLTYLLNRQEHSPPDTATTSTTGYSSAPASLILTPQEAQLDRLSSSMEGSLQLGHNSSSPSSAKSSQRNSLQSSLSSTLAHKSWIQDPQERRNPWRTQPSSSSLSSAHINTPDKKGSIEIPTISDEPSPIVPSDNCQGKVATPPSSSTNYTWHYTPSSKISQS